MTESSRGSIHALSGAYVVDALDDTERAAFEQHLPTCADCRAEVAELGEAAATLAHDAATAPPPALRAKVLADIRTVRPLPPETGAQVLTLRPRRFRWGAMAVAAAIVAVFGLVFAQPWNHDSNPGNVSAIDRVLTADDVTHVKVSLANGSVATVFRSKSEGKAAVVTESMAKAPKGKVYELWLRKADGDIVPAGLMSATGDHRQMLDGDAAKATAAAITIEPSGGSDTPTTEPIATFDFNQA